MPFGIFNEAATHEVTKEKVKLIKNVFKHIPKEYAKCFAIQHTENQIKKFNAIAIHPSQYGATDSSIAGFTTFEEAKKWANIVLMEKYKEDRVLIFTNNGNIVRMRSVLKTICEGIHPDKLNLL